MPPQVATPINSMNKKNLLVAPKTYMRQTKDSDLGMLLPIETEIPTQRRSNQLNAEFQEEGPLVTAQTCLHIPFVSPIITFP
jgi:hypothetical protein